MVSHRPGQRRRDRVLAVFGGSFNPPHLGHALLPGYVLARGDATRVLVAPCADHPLGKSLAPFERRMSWVRQALAQYDTDNVEVSPIEAELARSREGRPSYTLELLEALAQRYPDERVRLVVGSDILVSGETERWHRWDRITAEFDPIVVPRVGWSEPGAAALPDVSSTQVRAQLEVIRAHDKQVEQVEQVEQARRALRQMVPGAVADSLEAWIEQREPHVWIVGHGNVATHVCPWLRDRRFAVTQLGARALIEARALVEAPELVESLEQAPIAVWLLCQDGALRDVAAALVGRLPAETPVLHAAGARLAREVLAPLRDAGHPVGTLHPICALSRERSVSRLASASFGIAGDAAARAVAERLVGDANVLDIHHLDARGRMAYHAACALVANHLAVLEDRGAAILRGQGLAPKAIDRALGDLMIGSLENLLALGVPLGISGPLSRGDRATVEAHLAVLDDDATRSLYADLSERLARLLRERA
jgi:nicotinate (nicotinamide) nucleotide adenylyltransferase